MFSIFSGAVRSTKDAVGVMSPSPSSNSIMLGRIDALWLITLACTPIEGSDKTRLRIVGSDVKESDFLRPMVPSSNGILPTYRKEWSQQTFNVRPSSFSV